MSSGVCLRDGIGGMVANSLAEVSRSARLTFFRSAAACLHLPTRLTPESAKHEGRKPRTSERHAVGCSEELGGDDEAGS